MPVGGEEWQLPSRPRLHSPQSQPVSNRPNHSRARAGAPAADPVDLSAASSMVVRVATEQGIPPGQTTVVTLIASLRECYVALSAPQKSRVGHRVRPQSHAAAASPGILINWVDCFEQAPLDEFGTLFGIQYCSRKSCRCRVHADPGKRRMMVNLQPEESLPAELLNFLLHDSRDHPCPQCGEIPRREVSDLQLPRILACATLGSGVKLISRGPTSGSWPSHEMSPAIS